MEGINLSTFFAGFSSAFYTIYAVQFLTRYPRTRFQTVLGYIFVVWALFNWKDIVISFPDLYTLEVLDGIMLIEGWSALTYTVFIFEITMPGWATWRKLCLFSVPFLLFTAAYVLWPSQMVINTYAVFLWCYAWTVIIIAFFKVRRYMRYIRQNYSNIDEIDISWLRPVFVFCILSQLLWLATSLIMNVYVDALYYILTILLWVMVLRYTRHFHPVVVPAVVPTVSAVVPSDSAAKDYPFKERLEQVINQDAIYLDKHLTLDDMAKAIGTNRTYMSDYFNNVVGKPFFDYVNQQRITRKSIPMMQAHPEYTLEYIAEQSGFGSISTFRRAFQRLMGKSPSQWRQDLAFEPREDSEVG